MQNFSRDSQNADETGAIELASADGFTRGRPGPKRALPQTELIQLD
jgi:hypothetical protein